jgi:hypothetical protein
VLTVVTEEVVGHETEFLVEFEDFGIMCVAGEEEISDFQLLAFLDDGFHKFGTNFLVAVLFADV